LKKGFFLLNAAFAMAILPLSCFQVTILSITEKYNVQLDGSLVSKAKT
jgi:hypothetical protein